MTTRYSDILPTLTIVGIVYLCVSNFKLRNLIKQYNMATYTDLQTATGALKDASTALQTAITTFQASHADDITATQADAIVADINTATEALVAATASLTPTS